MHLTTIKYIVVHCSATRSDRAYTALDLERDHRARGFSSAGYHYYIRRSGAVEPLRPLNRAGAHVRGYNRCSIGVCYEGGLTPEGFPADTRTIEQRMALLGLLLQLKMSYLDARIVGHRDLSPDADGDGRVEPHEWLKQCPCFDAASEYEEL